MQMWEMKFHSDATSRQYGTAHSVYTANEWRWTRFHCKIHGEGPATTEVCGQTYQSCLQFPLFMLSMLTREFQYVINNFMLWYDICYSHMYLCFGARWFKQLLKSTTIIHVRKTHLGTSLIFIHTLSCTDLIMGEYLIWYTVLLRQSKSMFCFVLFYFWCVHFCPHSRVALCHPDC